MWIGLTDGFLGEGLFRPWDFEFSGKEKDFKFTQAQLFLDWGHKPCWNRFWLWGCWDLSNCHTQPLSPLEPIQVELALDRAGRQAASSRRLITAGLGQICEAFGHDLLFVISCQVHHNISQVSFCICTCTLVRDSFSNVLITICAKLLHFLPFLGTHLLSGPH